MGKQKNTQSDKGIAGEVRDLLASAEQELPGVAELLKVYGGYEQMVIEIRQYLDMTRPERPVTTSNHSYLET